MKRGFEPRLGYQSPRVRFGMREPFMAGVEVVVVLVEEKCAGSEEDDEAEDEEGGDELAVRAAFAARTARS